WTVYIVNGVQETDGGCMALTLGGTVTPASWPSQTPDAKNQILGVWNSSTSFTEVRVRRRFDTTVNFPGFSGETDDWLLARNVVDGTPTFNIFSDDGAPFGSLATCNP